MHRNPECRNPAYPFPKNGARGHPGGGLFSTVLGGFTSVAVFVMAGRRFNFMFSFSFDFTFTFNFNF